MKFKQNVVLALVGLALFAACNKNAAHLENEADHSQIAMSADASMTKSSYEELGYNNVDEMIKDGWKLVDTYKATPATNQRWAFNQNLTSRVEQEKLPITYNLLKDMGYDIYTRRDLARLKIKTLLEGKRPDGLSFSSNLTTEGSSHPTALERMGLEGIYIKLYPPQLEILESSIGQPDEIFRVTAYNSSNQESTSEVDYSYKTGYKTTWQKQVNGSLKVGVKAEIGVPMLSKFETNAEVTIGKVNTDGGENSTETTRSSKYKATVPAHSKKTLVVITKRAKSSVRYTVQMSVFGSVGANYPVPVARHGVPGWHYFHGFSADTFFLPPKSEQGVVNVLENFDVEIFESPAERI
ncbi:aerolysin family beta-barrel pore-forming toxin [Sphingobacterium sp. lm-10]|uniref:aerolysin family beta-barrel pore-forming toxin n=1 Tax=Sphingobacterium sp. lm-10 TaxID=2944904 RepID=UPI002021EA54|nr:aerolysin family beta-barrel pore-forming toxin [Sphingobacterium sp. lm-10]MCL7987032.1 aerolysin family beta-barrel pore-forming toxin [Sphingobacterium sp. lm-10]